MLKLLLTDHNGNRSTGSASTQLFAAGLLCRFRRLRTKALSHRELFDKEEVEVAAELSGTARPSAPGEIPDWSRSVKNLMKTTRLVLTVMTLFAAETNAGTQEQLAAYRQQIDLLDQRIVDLFQQRARLVEQVGNVKREAHLPVTVPSREQQVVEKAQELAKGGPMPAEAVGRIYQSW